MCLYLTDGLNFTYPSHQLENPTLAIADAIKTRIVTRPAMKENGITHMLNLEQEIIKLQANTTDALLTITTIRTQLEMFAIM